MGEVTLSIISCHPSSEDAPLLRGSIAANSGLQGAEIIVTVAGDSIAKKYNAGAARAKGDVLIFTHSDVELLSSRAMIGSAISVLARPSIGILGIAGARVLNNNAIWWAMNDQLSGACLHTDDKGHWMTAFGRYGRVVVLDGVLLMMTRRTFELVGPFDEAFPGFDYYDIDLTLRAHLAGFLNVTYPLHVLHHSVGEVKNKQGWHDARQQFIQKWREVLPVTT